MRHPLTRTMPKKTRCYITTSKNSASIIQIPELLTKYIKKSTINIEGIYSLVGAAAKAFTRLLHGSRRIFVNIGKLRPQGQKERAMRKSTLKGRVAAVVATFAVALGLVACGGGGGSDNIAAVPTPVPAPVATEPSWNNPPIPASAGTEAAKQFAASAPLRGTAQAGDPYAGVDPLNAIEQLLDFGERALPQYFPDHRATSVFEKIRFRYYPTSGTYLGVAHNVTPGDGLVEAGVYVMGSEFGNSPTHVGMLLDFMVPAKPTQTVRWYDPPVTATITPMHNWVVGANRLPAGCTSTLQQCWKESVQNGTVKFIKTSLARTDINMRPLMFAYYITEDGRRWDIQPFYSDTGYPTVGNGDMNLTGGDTYVVDRVYGNELGVIFEALGGCWQFKWYPAGDPSGRANVWATEKVACP